LGLLATQLAHGGGSPVCFNLPPIPFWDPQFSSLMAWSSVGISNYDAGQFILRHPLTHGLQIDFSYTFGKSMDMGSDAERTNSQGTTSTTASGLGPGSTTRSFIENPWNPRLNYAPSDFDIRHVISTTWVYELPLTRSAKAKAFLVYSVAVSGLAAKPALGSTKSSVAGNYRAWAAGRAHCHSASLTHAGSPTTSCLTTSWYGPARCNRGCFTIR